MIRSLFSKQSSKQQARCFHFQTMRTTNNICIRQSINQSFMFISARNFSSKANIGPVQSVNQPIVEIDQSIKQSIDPSMTDPNVLHQQLSEALSKRLCLDSSRLAFVHDTACTLYRLVVRKNLQDATRYRRLLLGRKGVGKTMLLKNVLNAAGQLLKSQGLICIYASLDDCKNCDILITEIIARELKKHNIDLPAECTIDDLEECLEVNNKAIFVVLDEIHLAYTNFSRDNGKEIIQQILSIGSTRGGRIHCVLSGNSTVVRRLCFAKMSLAEALERGYVHYDLGLDVNSSKFSPLWIHPFLDVDDFSKAASFLSGGDTLPDMDAMASIYMITGGNAGEMEKAFTNSQMALCPPHLITRLDQFAEDSDVKKILNSIVENVKLSRPENFDDALQMVASYASMVDRRAVMRGLFNEENSQILFEMADMGLIRLDHRSTPLIGLGSVALFMQCISSTNLSLTVEELFALQHPIGQYDAIAEHVVRRCLVKGAKGLLNLSHDLVDVGDLFLPVVNVTTQESSSVVSPTASSAVMGLANMGVTFHSAELEHLTTYVWKELSGKGPDSFGADAVVFQQKSDVLVVHRIQIKLGKGTTNQNSQLDQVNDVINRFNTMDSMKTDYQSRGWKLEFKHYLLTTRQLSPACVEALAKSNIEHLGSAKLKEHVWPAIVQQLGAPFK